MQNSQEAQFLFDIQNPVPQNSIYTQVTTLSDEDLHSKSPGDLAAFLFKGMESNRINKNRAESFKGMIVRGDDGCLHLQYEKDSFILRCKLFGASSLEPGSTLLKQIEEEHKAYPHCRTVCFHAAWEYGRGSPVCHVVLTNGSPFVREVSAMDRHFGKWTPDPEVAVGMLLGPGLYGRYVITDDVKYRVLIICERPPQPLAGNEKVGPVRVLGIVVAEQHPTVSPRIRMEHVEQSILIPFEGVVKGSDLFCLYKNLGEIHEEYPFSSLRELFEFLDHLVALPVGNICDEARDLFSMVNTVRQKFCRENFKGDFLKAVQELVRAYRIRKGSHALVMCLHAKARARGCLLGMLSSESLRMIWEFAMDGYVLIPGVQNKFFPSAKEQKTAAEAAAAAAVPAAGQKPTT